MPPLTRPTQSPPHTAVPRQPSPPPTTTPVEKKKGGGGGRRGRKKCRARAESKRTRGRRRHRARVTVRHPTKRGQHTRTVAANHAHRSCRRGKLRPPPPSPAHRRHARTYLHVVWALILVLEVVGMLPHIEAEDRNEPGRRRPRYVLISRGRHSHPVATGGINHQPNPPAHTSQKRRKTSKGRARRERARALAPKSQREWDPPATPRPTSSPSPRRQLRARTTLQTPLQTHSGHSRRHVGHAPPQLPPPTHRYVLVPDVLS